MASSQQLLTLSILTILLFLSSQLTQSSSNPKSVLFLPISKDPSTLQYLTEISIGTPLVSKTLVVDLGGRYLWIDCQKNYNSSTHKHAYCGSSTCSIITNTIGLGCNKDCERQDGNAYHDCNNTCALFPENTVIRHAIFDAVGIDTISVQITNGAKSSRPTVTIPNFIFSCARHSLLKGLAKGATGMAALGRNNISLPNQLSSAFGGSISKKFAMCLPSDPKSKGVVLFGDTNYIFYPSYNPSKHIDVSERFKHTPLYINPTSTSSIYHDNEPSANYFIGVKSIMVNKKPIPIDPALLTINHEYSDTGGTILSSVYPYTLLESSIYTAFANAVVKEFEVWNIIKVAPVKPFTTCFSMDKMSYTPLGLDAPDIEFVLENNAVWGMYGNNVMVEMSKKVACLGFVNGTQYLMPSIVIGARQMENNLIQFDPASSMMAFTGTLLMDEVKCGNYVSTT